MSLGFAMSTATDKILEQALHLSPDERAGLADGLLSSLDKPDPAIETLWLKEAEDRMAAYRAGELDAVDAEQVFAELGKNV